MIEVKIFSSATLNTLATKEGDQLSTPFCLTLPEILSACLNILRRHT